MGMNGIKPLMLISECVYRYLIHCLIMWVLWLNVLCFHFLFVWVCVYACLRAVMIGYSLQSVQLKRGEGFGGVQSFMWLCFYYFL